MAEPWYLLGLCKTKRAALAKQTDQIRQECTKNHSKKHVVECTECYQKLLAAIRDRYLLSQDTEWFTGRRAFLKEIDTMFSEAMSYKIHPSKVEARIQDEKKKWLRENTKSFVNSIQDPLIKDALQDRLNDKDIPLEDLAADLELAIGNNDGAADEAIQNTVDRLSAVKTTPERIEVYKETFLLESKDQPLPEHRQKYVDMLQAGKTMDQVLEQVRIDQRAADNARVKREELEERLDFFRRAKTAHGVKKAKKAAAKQERENRAKSREKNRELTRERTREQAREKEREKERDQPVVPPELFKQPPCHACGGDVSLTQGLRCCTVCQLFAGWKVQDSTVYCSEKCFRHPQQGQKMHGRMHRCAAGADCASLQDEDVDMDRHRSLVFCKECVDALKRPTVYCSLKCYEGHFQKHREKVHLHGRVKKGLVRDDIDELVYEDTSKTRYHPKDLRGGVKAWYEAVNGWESHYHVEFGPV